MGGRAMTHSERSRKWLKDHPEYRGILAEQRARRRHKLLDAYTHGTFRCPDCLLGDPRVLVFDHVDGSGAADRAAHGHAGVEWRLYNLLPKLDPNIEVVCHNCNFLRRLKLRGD